MGWGEAWVQLLLGSVLSICAWHRSVKSTAQRGSQTSKGVSSKYQISPKHWTDRTVVLGDQIRQGAERAE